MDKTFQPIGKKSEWSCNVSSVAEASELLRNIAGNGYPGEGTKAALRRVQNKLSRWNTHRLYSIWRGSERVRLSADEMNELRRVAGREKANGYEADLLARIERLEAALLAKDEAFYRPQVDALRSAAVRVGGKD